MINEDYIAEKADHLAKEVLRLRSENTRLAEENKRLREVCRDLDVWSRTCPPVDLLKQLVPIIDKARDVLVEERP